MRPFGGLIDVHHHQFPPAWARMMAEHGMDKVAGATVPPWTPQDSLALMERHDIARAILSVPAPGVYFGDLSQACDLARGCNEFAAETVAARPDRFGWFAVLPMPFTEESCREAAHALDLMKADGVILLGSTEGVFLGDPRLEELMAELDRRDAVVFVHPNLHPTSNQLGLQTPGFFIEFLCDTTRAATNLIYAGVLERHPHIRWILAHAGGFLPYAAWRIALADQIPEMARKMPQGVLAYLHRFWFDTALSTSPYAMAALEALAPERILFGSDFPFVPDPLVEAQITALADLPQLDDAARARLAHEAALTLFPRFRGSAG